jgi:hypothetical protein
VTTGDRSYVKILIGWNIGYKQASEEFLAGHKSQTKLQVTVMNSSQAATKQLYDEGHLRSS